jgi:short-subunit dehydrogenase
MPARAHACWALAGGRFRQRWPGTWRRRTTAPSISADLRRAPQNINVLVVYPGLTRTAHARRYSPDNRRESRRMLPEVLVAAVHRAIERRQRRLTPGFSNRLFALAGRWLPGTVDWIMKKTLYDKL